MCTREAPQYGVLGNGGMRARPSLISAALVWWFVRQVRARARMYADARRADGLFFRARACGGEIVGENWREYIVFVLGVRSSRWF